MSARVDICMDNGKTHSFVPKTPQDLEQLVAEISSMRILTQASILFASDQYLAHLQPRSVEIIRCHLPEAGTEEPDTGTEDIVEISKDRLVEEYLKLPEAEKFSSRNKAPGEFMTTFLEIHTEGNVELFLRLYIRKKKAQEGRQFITHLFEQPFLRFRINGGGFGIVIPTKITCQYTYPGPAPDVLPANVFNVS